MAEQASDPNAEQVTIWRNLLDTFGQLQSAWEIAVRAQQNAGPGEGPGTMHMPEEMIAAFAEAGGKAAAILEGLAQVLSEQPGHRDFGTVAEAGGEARRRWQAAHEQLGRSASQEPAASAAADTSRTASTSPGD